MIKKQNRFKGFSLIELMISVAIIGILAGIAYPSYSEYVLKGKRGDAKAALLSVQLAEEKYRANNIRYATFDELGMDLNGPNVTGTNITQDGYYSVTVSGNTTTNYIITAAPNSPHADAYCTTFVINQDGIKTATGSDSAHCW